MSAAIQPLASRHVSQPLAFQPLGAIQARSQQPVPSAHQQPLQKPQHEALGSCAALSRRGQGLQRRARGSCVAARRRTSTALAVRAVIQDAYVRVEPGDTLDSLAESFRVARADFVACNRDLISSENLIYEGDLLRVPAHAWKGVEPPGLEGRIVLRTPGSLADALATVGTALQLLPSYLGLGAGARLPAGAGGWLMLGGALMVVLGAVGRLRRGAAAASPTSAATLARVRGVRGGGEPEAEAVPWAPLGDVKLRSYAMPGLPPNMRGPYTGTFQTPDNLPNQLMQASILQTEKNGSVTGAPKKEAAGTGEAREEAPLAAPQPVVAAVAAPPASQSRPDAAKAELATPSIPTPVAATAVQSQAAQAEKEKEAVEEGKKGSTEPKKLHRKDKEGPKHSPEAVASAGKVLAAATAAAAPEVAPSNPSHSAPTSAPTPAPAPAAVVAPPPPAPEAVPASGGWSFPAMIFGKDNATTVFRFGPDATTPEASPSAAEAAPGPSTSADSASTSSSPSTSPGSGEAKGRAWGPYSLGGGWAGSQESGRDAKQGGAGEVEELTVPQKAVQAAIPALALGAGAASFVTGGWPGAMEAVGLTFVASFVGYDLLWADKRAKLLQELRGIRSPADVARFLENRSISPKW